jgi:histidine phosphotransferase ChpT
MSADIHLLEQLVSRICHDLISPVGAIQNGLEFLEEMGPSGLDDAKELLGHSASQAAGRLKLFRLAFGAGGRDPNIGLSDVWKIFGEYLGPENRLQQDWSPMDVSAELSGTPAGLAKATCAGLLIASECLPKGGKIRVVANGPYRVDIVADAPTVLFPDSLKQALDGQLPADAHDAKLINAVVLKLICDSFGIKLTYSGDGGTAPLLSLTFPQ